LITRSGIALLEIPPVPSGYSFMSCLTHDLDHPSLRKHCFDHTMFGFLYRATVQTLVHACRGRKPVGKLARNLAAASRLPLVYLGVARDPWSGFDRYLQIEAGAGSTYFVIPKRDYAGRSASGQAPLKRASRYSVTDIKPQLEKIMSAGCEVSLHGLDAWLDSDSGSEERETLFKTSGTRETGVRMHWLYFNEQSPAALDRAGFSYDSSFGYNQTVGFRAGTAQAFKPFGTANLLELPLHVMDTALFYPNYLDLSEKEAQEVVWKIIDAAEQFGGALTINWHDRSIAPERLWNDFYVKLLEELKRRGAWLPTAANAIAWFRTRRAASFGSINRENGGIKVTVSGKGASHLPGLRARVHQPKAKHLLEPVSSKNGQTFIDTNLTNNADQEVIIKN
jgi:peptidoglycan/xylan/chitin deacetylase (PgdA/CDA1 family)